MCFKFSKYCECYNQIVALQKTYNYTFSVFYTDNIVLKSNEVLYKIRLSHIQNIIKNIKQNIIKKSLM